MSTLQDSISEQMDSTMSKEQNTCFEDWLYGQEGFGLRAERFFEEECGRDVELFIKMKKWLEAAYEAGQRKDT